MDFLTGLLSALPHAAISKAELSKVLSSRANIFFRDIDRFVRYTTEKLDTETGDELAYFKRLTKALSEVRG